MDIFKEPTTSSGPSVLMAIMFGESCSGKSSTIGTYSGKKILYVTTSIEAHGIVNAMKVNASLAEQKKIKPSTFVHVNLGLVQDLDFKTEFIPKGKGLKVGDPLPQTAASAKLFHYTNVALTAKPDVFVVDSISSLYEDFKSAPEIRERCTSKNGELNQWAVYGEVDSMYTKLLQQLRALNSVGVATVCTCLSKFDSFKEEDGVIKPEHFSPVVPSVSAARVIKSWFDTSLLLYRHRSSNDNVPFFKFDITGSRTSKERGTGNIANDTGIDLRSQFLPYGWSLDKLPADLENLEANTMKRGKPPQRKE